MRVVPISECRRICAVRGLSLDAIWTFSCGLSTTLSTSLDLTRYPWEALGGRVCLMTCLGGLVRWSMRRNMSKCQYIGMYVCMPACYVYISRQYCRLWVLIFDLLLCYCNNSCATCISNICGRTWRGGIRPPRWSPSCTISSTTCHFDCYMNSDKVLALIYLYRGMIRYYSSICRTYCSSTRHIVLLLYLFT